MKPSFVFLRRAACVASLSLLCTPLSWAQDPVDDAPVDQAPSGVVTTTDDGGSLPDDPLIYSNTAGDSSDEGEVTDDGGDALPDDPLIYETFGPLAAGQASAVFHRAGQHLYTSSSVFYSSRAQAANGANTSAIPPVVGPPAVPIDGPALSGSVSKLKFRTNEEKTLLRIRAKVSLTNIAGKTLRGITATVYLSEDGALDADDTKLTTLDLGKYLPKDKLGKGRTRKVSLDQKVPAALAAALQGKYLIVDLAAANAGETGENYQVVIGPIDLR